MGVIAILWVTFSMTAQKYRRSIPSPLRQAISKRSNPAGALGAPGGKSMPRPDSSVVERGPEKAGVGGSIPSLATTF